LQTYKIIVIFGYEKNIAVTLPKQIIVKSTAEFAAETLDVKLGEHVGYQYKGSDRKHMNKETINLFSLFCCLINK